KPAQPTPPRPMSSSPEAKASSSRAPPRLQMRTPARPKIPCSARPPRRPLSRASLHLQRPALARRKVLRLIHRLHARRAHFELAGVHHFEEIDVLRPIAAEPCLEQRGVIIMKFPPGIGKSPPRRPVLEAVQLVVLDEFH